jgi:hypothetical protein
MMTEPELLAGDAQVHPLALAYTVAPSPISKYFL